MRIFKRILISLLILMTIGSLSYGSILAKSMYHKYTSTVEWENSSLQSKIHMVPPSLAQNYVTGEEQILLGMVADVNAALEEIKVNQGVSEDKYEGYMNLLDSINKEIEKNEDNKDFLKDEGLSDFTFYLEADSTIRNAYESLNVEGLESLESTFANRILKNEQSIDKLFLEKVQKIAKDFRSLEEFSENAMDKLGAIENNTLNVNLSVNKNITDKLLKQIEEKDLRKFPHIEKLYGILTSESWLNILAHNENSKDYFAWKESKEILESLSKVNYIPISSFVTVEDVLAKYPNAELKQKANHTINNASVVQGVYYNGKLLNETLYVKRGTELEFSVEYEYIEDPKSTITVEYLDNLGNQLNVGVFENYVGKQISIDTELEGYVLLDSENFVEKFPEENATVKLIYEKYVPPEITEEDPVEEPIEEPLEEQETEPNGEKPEGESE